MEEAFIRTGTLAEVGISGGVAPREILKDVQWADWAPDGKEIAVVRDVSLRNQLEFPIGKVLYQTAGWISHPRVSHDGTLVAFIDHSQRRDDGGVGRGGRPGGKEAHALGRVRLGVRPRVVPERNRDLGHRREGRRQSRAARDLALRSRAPARAGDAEPDPSGRLGGRTAARRARHDPHRRARWRRGTDEGAGAGLARLVVPLRPFGRRQDRSLLGDRRGRGARVFDVHPPHGRLSAGATG